MFTAIFGGKSFENVCPIVCILNLCVFCYAPLAHWGRILPKFAFGFLSVWFHKKTNGQFSF